MSSLVQYNNDSQALLDDSSSARKKMDIVKHDLHKLLNSKVSNHNKNKETFDETLLRAINPTKVIVYTCICMIELNVYIHV